jgi:hypothetical protein
LVPLALFEVFKWGRKNKDELIKMASFAIIIVVSIMLLITVVGHYKAVKVQAKGQSPSYTQDWQEAMSWVRNNTPPGSVFLHWWDYGYWVQTGGERPTVTDGGHFNGYWDHLVGRYVLTTPNPATAKSFMKAQNVSYLLIDPSDIGKYSAYSSIGDAENVSDRASWLVTLLSDPSQTQETRNGSTILYTGGTYLDEDLMIQIIQKIFSFQKGKRELVQLLLRKQQMDLISLLEFMFIVENNIVYLLDIYTQMGS